jgi:hypothetical protein
MAPPFILPSPIIIPSKEDSLEGFGGMLAGLLLLVWWLLVCSGVFRQLTAPPLIPPSPMAPPPISPSPIVVWSRKYSVEEHGGAFAGLIFPGELVRLLMLGLLLYCIHSILVHEHFSTANTLTVQQKSQFWQCHGIDLDVRHAVTLPELAVSLQKESNSLRKGAGGRNALKWGLVGMVLWSVRGRSCFFCFLLFDFVSCRGKKWRGNYPFL